MNSTVIDGYRDAQKNRSPSAPSSRRPHAASTARAAKTAGMSLPSSPGLRVSTIGMAAEAARRTRSASVRRPRSSLPDSGKRSSDDESFSAQTYRSANSVRERERENGCELNIYGSSIGGVGFPFGLEGGGGEGGREGRERASFSRPGRRRDAYGAPSLPPSPSPSDDEHASRGREKPLTSHPRMPPATLLSGVREEAESLKKFGGSASPRAAPRGSELGALHKLVRASQSPGRPALDSVRMYTLGRTIGRGAFGAVKAATHKLTGLGVAVKVYKRADIKTDAEARALEREVAILKKMGGHAHIVRLYEVIQSPSHLYFVLELAGAGDLTSLLRARCPEGPAGGLTESAAADLFAQACDAVAHCHSHGIVHRDIKPDNLLLARVRTNPGAADFQSTSGSGGAGGREAGPDTKKVRLLLTDFGLSAYPVRPGQRLRVPCGTPSHAAPEILEKSELGKSEYDGFITDVWALGVLLFELCHGVLPFDSTQAVLQGSFDVADVLSIAPSDLIMGILRREANERLTLDQVRRVPWVLSASQRVRRRLPTCERLGGSRANVPDPQVIALVEATYGYAAEKVRESLAAAEFDHGAATYMLLEDARPGD